MCYSSNLQTKAVDSPEDYPLAVFAGKGIRISVNTDSMTVSDTTLWREYNLLKRQFALEEGALKDLALNAVQGAFITEGEKEKLREQIDQNFAGWLCHMK